jgi:hypothetical protein
MPIDYIPPADAEFDTWQARFATYLIANLAALGLPPGDPDVAALTAARTDWESKYPAHIAAREAANSAREAKQESRQAYTTVIRRLVRRLQASPAVDDTERAALGITIPDREPTPVSPPETRPILQADTSQRLRITISFRDEGMVERTGKPPGVMGCELYVKIGGDPPRDLDECTYLATDTASPYVAVFEGEDAGKTAHFIGRWVSTRGEPGPISVTVSATIPG